MQIFSYPRSPTIRASMEGRQAGYANAPKVVPASWIDADAIAAWNEGYDLGVTDRENAPKPRMTPSEARAAFAKESGQ